MTRSSKTSPQSASVEPVYFQTAGPMLLAGLRRRYNRNTRHQIPLLWHEVGPHFGKIPSESGDAYGVCLSASEENGTLDYMAAIEVGSTQNLPANWTSLKLPAQCYAVFIHPGHVSEVSVTVEKVFENWLPSSGSESMSGKGGIPDFMEHYGRGYKPEEGTGDIEIWLPVKG